MAVWNSISERIGEATGEPFRLVEQRTLAGGCISAAYRIDGEDGRRFFVKLNSADGLDMFEAEAAGLEEIVGSGAIRAPAPVAWGLSGDQSWLAMEYLELDGVDSVTAAQLGRDLAAMHGCTRERFGWYRDNTIGATPQPNDEAADWVEFWRRHRLGFQLELAARNGYNGNLRKRGDELMEAFDGLFRDYRPAPSLLHGDLWSGNFSALTDGTPVIFDPAVYYGDREADLAMTELFGGFPPAFYDAYREAWPMDAGYPVRKHFYNLYHILNHLNLFGTAYLGRAEQIIDRLLSELR